MSRLNVRLDEAGEALISKVSLIEPGDQLDFQGAETWRGYVLGVSINAPGSGAINVNQTARIIRYHEH